MTAAAAGPGRLVVCPTPIGTLGDVTLRLLEVLAEADLVACEDTRHTKRLLERYELSPSLVSLHEHNERSRAGELVDLLPIEALGSGREHEYTRALMDASPTPVG